MFPEEIPYGLPPLRCIENQIDFIPGASLPNRPAYIGQVQKKQKEIQRKVDKFLQKEFVRESLSPCFIPVILVQRKMGHNACVQMTEP